MDVAQHDINFSCETNTDIRFVDGPHKGTTAVPDFGFGKYPTNSTADMEYIIILESGYSQLSTKLRNRARMWLTLPTVISVITIDFRTKQYTFPKSNPGNKMVPLTRIAFGKQAGSLLEAITVGGETWAHPITAIELTLYVQQSGACVSVLCLYFLAGPNMFFFFKGEGSIDTSWVGFQFYLSFILLTNS